MAFLPNFFGCNSVCSNGAGKGARLLENILAIHGFCFTKKYDFEGIR